MSDYPSSPTDPLPADPSAGQRAVIPCGDLLVGEFPPRCAQGRDMTFCGPGGACCGYTPGINDAERTRCEVWTRVMGYHRPLSAFNAGKQSEHAERKLFIERPGDLGGALG